MWEYPAYMIDVMTLARLFIACQFYTDIVSTVRSVVRRPDGWYDDKCENRTGAMVKLMG